MSETIQLDFAAKNKSIFSRNVPRLPGKASSSPRKEMIAASAHRNTPATSFDDFQESVSDAWDLGDDEFCIISDVKISKKMAQSTAASVINRHRTQSADQAIQNHQIPSITKNANRSFPGHPHPFLESAQSRKMNEDLQSGKMEKFNSVLNSANSTMKELEECSWHGIPPPVRAITWRLLSGYIPINLDKRASTLKRKREEYWNLVEQYYETRHEETHQDTFRQIHIDIPRMSPLIALFQQSIVQEMFERILYIWAMRHPASGYVQGINDLVTPFFVVFLQEVIPSDSDLDTHDVSKLSEEDRNSIEADSFWCLSKLLDGIQDNYTFAQPGIQNRVRQLKELIERVDVELHQHLVRHEVDYLQFSFRWMNNLLMRELPLLCTVRLWDTCLAQPHGFADFHLYTCAAFLLKWRNPLLRQTDFQGLMMMLQNLPTQSWSDEEIGEIVAEAYQLHYMFSNAPNHLQSSASKP
ncbi:hypothetical protein GHT06_017823 [Daphnia sinensis]|uniref:Rab-GAP TBC domain-containing protein n=1 Tax=Daphnia sinensis TaxID=1820382 RepID=A0AAD5L406_9CRUS|nr:hypothetical protein GHT06_017823 [Daphnia sinensis]